MVVAPLPFPKASFVTLNLFQGDGKKKLGRRLPNPRPRALHRRQGNTGRDTAG
jgi:hypothetical protein